MQSQLPRHTPPLPKHTPPHKGFDFGNLPFALIALVVVGLSVLVSLFWFVVGLLFG